MVDSVPKGEPFGTTKPQDFIGIVLFATTSIFLVFFGFFNMGI